MIDYRLLSEQGPETAAQVRAAIARLDPRQIEIIEKLDQPHRLKYLLAISESERMDIHRDYWREKFGAAAKTIAGLSVLPLVVGAGLSVTSGVMKTTGDDAVMLGGMAMAMAGAAAVVHMAKEKAVEVAARHVEGKAAKLVGPAMASIAPALPELAPHPVQKLAGLATRAGSELTEGELAVQRVVGHIVSRTLDARTHGRQIAEAQLREWGAEVNSKLADLGRRDPLAARRSVQRMGAMLRNYGIEIEAANPGLGVGAPSRRFAMD